MDKRKILKLSQEYLETIANASDFNFVDEDQMIPLTQVYVMLEAIKTEPPKAKEKRDEMSSTEERRQGAGLYMRDEERQQIRQPPFYCRKC